MRGKICIFVAALAALLALQGCMRRDAVIFQGISDVEVSMEASPRVGVVLLVENTSGRNITVRDASFVLTSRDGGRIAKARVEGELYLPKRCRTELYVPLQCSLDNPLKALAVLGDIEGNAPLLFVTGGVTVKAGSLKKTFGVEKMPLSEFLRYFGESVSSFRGA